MKRSSSKKSIKLPGLNENKLITASLLVVAWCFVVETYVPTAWGDSASAFWGFMTAFSPFIVAAVLAYVFVFGVFKSQYLRIALSLVVGVALFVFGFILGPIAQLLPPSIGSSLVWGNLFIAVFFGAGFALIGVIASKVQRRR